MPNFLAREIAARVEAETRCRVDITVEGIPLLVYDGIPELAGSTKFA